MLNVSNYVSFVRQSFLPTSTSFSLPHSLLLPLSNLLLLLTPSPEKGEGRSWGGVRGGEAAESCGAAEEKEPEMCDRNRKQNNRSAGTRARMPRKEINNIHLLILPLSRLFRG